jgi:hypothetical protein
MTFDRILLARILFTLMTAGWAIATVFADFNKTHATNPKWTPHARFHVVWQISSYVGFGLLALATSSRMIAAISKALSKSLRWSSRARSSNPTAP